MCTNFFIFLSTVVIICLFFMVTILMNMKWYLIIYLIRDVEHLWIWLLTICISSLKKNVCFYLLLYFLFVFSLSKFVYIYSQHWPLIRYVIWKYILLSYVLFHSVDNVLWCTKVCNFYKTQFYLSFFCYLSFWCPI